jgi:hypothetical protein
MTWGDMLAVKLLGPQLILSTTLQLAETCQQVVVMMHDSFETQANTMRHSLISALSRNISGLELS